jgi:uncharacterized protein YdiU (UPF0061 family)
MDNFMADTPARIEIGGRFDNSYARLPGRFFQQITPHKVAAPGVIKVNFELARGLGLELAGLDETALAAVFSGDAVPVGAEPIAQAYAGHQFGGFSPQLGDGRAVLLGEVVDPTGRRWDVALKGSGRTAFSRGGDGKAALGPVLREYLISEAMVGLGIPATRALAAVTTGEMVRREGMLPGAVFTRVAASHVRVGTFQFFASRGDAEGLRVLADYVIGRHYPEVAGAENPYLALLEGVVRAQAALIARWMGAGFIHGVMNTDNMTVSGETIDFGPCAFMEGYDPGTVFSAIDEYGRYAYGNQPKIAVWNLARLAETLLPLFGMEDDAAVEAATAAINGFSPAYQAGWVRELRGKLGVVGEDAGEAMLGQGFLDLMQAREVDFTLGWRTLGDDGQMTALLGDDDSVTAWSAAWRKRAGDGAVARVRERNPLYVPRNHRVEEAIAAGLRGDFSKFEILNEVLARPFEEQPGREDYALPARPEERVLQTFCGT